MADALLETPGGSDLLVTARAVLLERLLPLLPEGARLEARMVANAMAIAARDCGPESDTTAEVAALGSLLGGGGDDPAALLARFAAAIRDGAFDPGTDRRAEAAAVLRRIVDRRCRVSSPKALGA